MTTEWVELNSTVRIGGKWFLAGQKDIAECFQTMKYLKAIYGKTKTKVQFNSLAATAGIT